MAGWGQRGARQSLLNGLHADRVMMSQSCSGRMIHLRHHFSAQKGLIVADVIAFLPPSPRTRRVKESRLRFFVVNSDKKKKKKSDKSGKIQQRTRRRRWDGSSLSVGYFTLFFIFPEVICVHWNTSVKIVSRCFGVAKCQSRSEFFFSRGAVDEETAPIFLFFSSTKQVKKKVPTVVVGAALAVVAPHLPIMARMRLTSSHI